MRDAPVVRRLVGDVEMNVERPAGVPAQRNAVYDSSPGLRRDDPSRRREISGAR